MELRAYKNMHCTHAYSLTICAAPARKKKVQELSKLEVSKPSTITTALLFLQPQWPIHTASPARRKTSRKKTTYSCSLLNNINFTEAYNELF